MRNVIFLDIDGVICLQKQWGSRKNNKGKKYNRKYDLFDPKAIRALNKILQESGAEIVLSSTWRIHYSIEEMNELFSERGIKGQITDYTPLFETDPEAHGDSQLYAMEVNGKNIYFQEFWCDIRSKEIRYWLRQNKDVSKWVAIDDMPLEGLKNFIRTPYPFEGIKQCGIHEKVMKHL